MSAVRKPVVGTETCPLCGSQWWLYAPKSEATIAYVCGTKNKRGVLIRGDHCHGNQKTTSTEGTHENKD